MHKHHTLQVTELVTEFSWKKIHTVFPLINAPSAYQITRLKGAVLNRGWRIKERDAY